MIYKTRNYFRVIIYARKHYFMESQLMSEKKLAANQSAAEPD